MGVGLLEIVAKSVIQGSSWLHVGGLGANLAPRWTNLVPRKLKTSPKTATKTNFGQILVKFWTIFDNFLDKF